MKKTRKNKEDELQKKEYKMLDMKGKFEEQLKERDQAIEKGKKCC